MADSLAKEWLQRADKAFERQSGTHSLYQSLAEIFFPERASFFNESMIGDEYYREIFDGYPILMRWRLGNALGAMTRGRGQEWFKSQSFPFHLNDRDDVSAWNEDTTRTLRAILYDPRAQFGPAMAVSDQDYATFGASCVKATTNRDMTGMLYVTKHLSRVAGEENGEGEIDITHEKLRPTGRVLLEMFERGKLSRAMKAAATKDVTADIDGVMLSVFPVDQYEPTREQRRATKRHKFVALYIDRESQSVIQTEFFWSFPYIWRRWMRAIAGSPLALSPCAMVGLADAHMGQDIRRTLIEAMEHAADPALMISASAVEGPLDLAPSGENYIRRGYDWRTGAPIQAVKRDAMPNSALEFARDNREFQGQAWLINLLTLPQDRTMTAYETERVLDQDAREASPIFEPMEADNARFMARTYSVADEWSAFAQKPDVLKRGAETRYEFETPVSAALRRLRAQQGMQVVAAVREFGLLEQQVGRTESYRRVDWLKVQKDTVRGIGPADWLRPDDAAAEDIAEDQQSANIQEAVALAAQSSALGASALNMGAPAGALPAPGAVKQLPAPTEAAPA